MGCQGGGEGCGNACAAPGSKCCKPFGPRSAWYPVSEDTPCLSESTQCRNEQGKKFECAAGDRCCGGACVAHGDACCENVLGTTSHARETTRGRAAAAETRATRLAASAAGLLGSPRPGGTQSPRPPSAHSEGSTEGLQPKAHFEAFSAMHAARW